MKSEMVEKLKAHLASISQEEFKKEWKEITGDNLDEKIEETENIGKDIIDYVSKYKGKEYYNDIMLGMEFGYQLALKYKI